MEKKKDGARFMHARQGDSLVSPFQCDWCLFENLEGRRPETESYSNGIPVGGFWTFFGAGRKERLLIFLWMLTGVFEFKAY